MKNLRDRLIICQILEDKKRQNSCPEYKRYCDYCIDIVKSGVSSLYIEVLQFLGMDQEISETQIKEVNRIIRMYEELELMLKGNTKLYKQYQKYLFSGFTDQLCESYYLFLKRNHLVTIPRHEGKSKTLKEYRTFLKRFKHSIIQEGIFLSEQETKQ